MFTSVEQVRAVTGYSVTLDLVNQAQAIIESFVGRVEADVESADDMALLGRATAFQAAYMQTNGKAVYEQIAVRSVAQTDGGVVMDTRMKAPWIAPLAFLALRTLSWKGNRSVKTGPISDGKRNTGSWVTD